MILVFDLPSSLAFWREIYPLTRTPHELATLPQSECASTRADVHSIASSLPFYEKLLPNDKLYALGFEESCRRQSKHHAVHVCKSKAPFGSFYELQENIFVESPEYLFLRAATILDFPQLIALGDELCGFYSFSLDEERGFRKRQAPLSSAVQLERFIASARGCHGLANARKALQFVIERSASPMETYDEMLMCLPYHHGGYGVSEPEMNLRVSLSPKAARIARRENCYLDMGWSQQKLDIEHHGKLDHSSPEDKASDRARVNALKEMGYEVIELTHDQVNDALAFEFIILRVANLLGKRIGKAYLGVTQQRAALRRSLLAWNSSSGRVVW